VPPPLRWPLGVSRIRADHALISVNGGFGLLPSRILKDCIHHGVMLTTLPWTQPLHPETRLLHWKLSSSAPDRVSREKSETTLPPDLIGLSQRQGPVAASIRRGRVEERAEHRGSALVWSASLASNTAVKSLAAILALGLGVTAPLAAQETARVRTTARQPLCRTSESSTRVSRVDRLDASPIRRTSTLGVETGVKSRCRSSPRSRQAAETGPCPRLASHRRDLRK